MIEFEYKYKGYLKWQRFIIEILLLSNLNLFSKNPV